MSTGALVCRCHEVRQLACLAHSALGEDDFENQLCSLAFLHFTSFASPKAAAAAHSCRMLLFHSHG